MCCVERRGLLFGWTDELFLPIASSSDYRVPGGVDKADIDNVGDEPGLFQDPNTQRIYGSRQQRLAIDNRGEDKVTRFVDDKERPIDHPLGSVVRCEQIDFASLEPWVASNKAGSYHGKATYSPPMKVRELITNCTVGHPIGVAHKLGFNLDPILSAEQEHLGDITVTVAIEVRGP